MSSETVIDGLTDSIATSTTRRRVLKTGAKLAYVAPLVAASFKLNAHGALAACGGDTPYAFTFEGEALCCGCCQQGAGAASLVDVFKACQEVLKAHGITCPVAGEPGSDKERVCIAQNIS
jgi:hypothetical protein